LEGGRHTEDFRWKTIPDRWEFDLPKKTLGWVFDLPNRL